MKKQLSSLHPKFMQARFGLGAAALLCITLFVVGINSIKAAEPDSAAASPAKTPPPLRAPLDFNGDGKTDYVVVRSANRNSPSFWYINSGNALDAKNGQQWGQGVRTYAGNLTITNETSDIAVPADYDGDGKTDFAVWRPGAQAYFYILQSSNNTFRAEAFGQTGDDPAVVGDYDGDGKADIAVYRYGTRGVGASGGQNFFYYRPSGTPGVNFRAQAWGAALYPGANYAGDVAYPGDYDGDGRADFIVQRADTASPTGIFYILKSNGGFEVVYWGNMNDYLVPGDYDGDGRTDLCVMRPDVNAGAKNYFIRYANGATQRFIFGLSEDPEVPGDYDGDGRTDIGVYNYLTGRWSILPMSGAPPFYFYWGKPGTLFEPATDSPPANYIVRPAFRFP